MKTVSKEALAAAKEIKEQHGKINTQASKMMHEAACGDSWGPSVMDMKEACEWATN